jgi:hypothetical protein
MMKKAILILIALLLCVSFAGSVSAWATNTEAQINPSGSLVPGDYVVATMRLAIEEGDIGSSGTLTLSTPLSSPRWTVDIISGDITNENESMSSGTPISSFEASKSSHTISGFSLNYAYNVVVVITVTGTVPENMAGKDISVLSITQSPSRGISSYSSPVQKVYNPMDLGNQTSAIQEKITALDARITAASERGVDVSEPLEKIASANSYLSSARSAGSSNIASASANLANAESAIAEASRLLAGSCLAAIKSNLDATDSILSQLAAKGWNSDNRVLLLTTTKQGAKNLYDTVQTAYASGTGELNTATSSQLDEALADSGNALTTAQGLLDESNKSILDNLGGILPFIIIGAVVIIVIAGVVIFLRNRDDDWDELG